MHYRVSLFDSSDSTSKHNRSPGKRRGSALTVDSGGEVPFPHNRQKKTNGLPLAPIQALPGRPRRRRAVGSRRSSSSLSLGSILQQIWMNCKGTGSFTASLWIAVLLWYSLGVVSIATSKVLLTGNGGSIRVSPLALTLQQLLIGSSLLRFLLRIRFLGSSGLKSWASVGDWKENNDESFRPKGQASSAPGRRELFMAAICFSLGFLATNYGFAGSAASFVETIKAAEPLTSATVAAAHGIETITLQQQASLGTIVAGVLLSTLGHGGSSASSQSLYESVLACFIVMASNLFFSFRGLYQKLFRRHATAQALDDLNLQFRMQWIGVLLLIIPTLLFDFVPSLWYGTSAIPLADAVPRTLAERHDAANTDSSPFTLLLRYCLLSLLNGCAFTSYNLASTYILSRISVVHHAALNCIRRVFAIVVTSLLFGVPITVTGATGICLAVAGFVFYTHYKVQQQQQLSSSQQRHSKQPLSSLLPVSVTQ
jgi:drug/metabolite transporter (DMT)-like permease